MRNRGFYSALLLLALLPACSSVSLEHANFAWPIEAVLTVNSMNMIEEGRYAFSVNVGPLAEAEFQDSTALRGKAIRIIRNAQGYYFVTGPRFKNVYIFRAGEGSFDGVTSIRVSETGLNQPALNQRHPFIELLDGSAPPHYLTNSDFLQERPR
jgi:hypothetical protein